MTAQARQVVGVPRRQLLLAAVLGLLVAAVVVGAGAYLLLRQTSAADSWPGFRGDAGRSGAAATGPVGNPVLAWQFHAAGGFHGDLAIAGDLVLGVSDDGVLHALGITDGVERWTHPIANTVRGPFVIDGRVYVAGGDGIVHALNLTDGSTYWSTSAGYLGPSDLSLRDGHLYVGTTDGLVAAIDAASGRELWHTAISPANAPVHGPSTASGVVVAATDDGYLADLDPASGAIRWRIQASPLLVGTPVLGLPGQVARQRERPPRRLRPRFGDGAVADPGQLLCTGTGRRGRLLDELERRAPRVRPLDGHAALVDEDRWQAPGTRRGRRHRLRRR